MIKVYSKFAIMFYKLIPHMRVQQIYRGCCAHKFCVCHYNCLLDISGITESLLFAWNFSSFSSQSQISGNPSVLSNQESW